MFLLLKHCYTFALCEAFDFFGTSGLLSASEFFLCGVFEQDFKESRRTSIA